MTERRVAVRELAARLSERDDVPQSRELLRRYITRWRRGGTGISDAWAWKLAETLGLPDGYFVKPRAQRSVADDLRRIEDENTAAREEIRTLRAERHALRTAHDALRDDLDKLAETG